MKAMYLRAKAQSEGKTYFKHTVCPRCGDDRRYAASGYCVTCTNTTSAERQRKKYTIKGKVVLRQTEARPMVGHLRETLNKYHHQFNSADLVRLTEIVETLEGRL